MRNAVIALLVVLVAGLVWWQGNRQPGQVAPTAVVEAPGVTPEVTAPGPGVAPTVPEPAEEPVAEAPVDFDAQVEAMTRRDSEGLEVETLPDGSKKIDLQGRYRQAPVARVNDEGEAEVSEQ